MYECDFSLVGFNWKGKHRVYCFLPTVMRTGSEHLQHAQEAESTGQVCVYTCAYLPRPIFRAIRSGPLYLTLTSRHLSSEDNTISVISWLYTLSVY